MDITPLSNACPFCKAEPGQPCKNAADRRLKGFHRQRYQEQRPREEVNQAAARIVREATKE
jgi:hypothetical protein